MLEDIMMLFVFLTPGAKNCLEFMHAKGHDVTYLTKEGNKTKIFWQRGAHILKMIYQKVP
jgi:hypothetical protein